ncbi:WD repeat-containing protein JIP5 [Coccomyxa sp. Obi]|nr:WD repeat-containing protein JIP5 [Coccomyxa sp. Obi]
MQNSSIDVELQEQPMDCCFHPTEMLAAVGLINGRVQAYRLTSSDDLSSSTAEELVSKKAHKESCRAVRFTADGAALLTASTDRNMKSVDMESGKVTRWQTDAHEAPINCILPLSSSGLVASGDDDGCVKLWDGRQSDAVAEFSTHTDCVTDFAYQARENCLVATSADATISITDLRTRKLRARSEDDADDELLSAAVVKSGNKVVTGSQMGVLNLYSWGYFNDCSDRFPGHPASVDALVAFDEDSVVTGSQDGLIRLISILPNRMLGVLGEHGDLPVESLALSAGRAYLASTSHDALLRLWDLSALNEDDAEDDDDEAADNPAAEGDGPKGDGSESDSDEKPQKKKKRRKSEKGGGVTKKQSHKDASFFADLL